VPSRGFLLLLLLSTAGLADTYPRQPGIDAVHYTFRIALRDDTDEISGDADVHIRFQQENVAAVFLDLASPSAGKGMKVLAVTSEGQPVPFTHAANRLRIALATPPAPGSSRVFKVVYRGRPASGLRIGPNKYGDRTFFSSNWPDLARQWLPAIDHPYDKAGSEFLITAPVRYQVVANGTLLEQTDLPGGVRLTHWKQEEPIAVWLNAIGVAQFARRDSGTVRNVPLQTWVYPQDRENGRVTFEEPARRALDFFVTNIGPYPYAKLANVEAAGISGGVENASAIFYSQAAVTPHPATSLVTHEIAHQWFGNSVTEKAWEDVWLSEGFATYCALLALENDAGPQAFAAALKASREEVWKAEQDLPGAAVIHNQLADLKPLLNGLVYQKGAWVLHMLRNQMGTEKFWAGLREYYRRYRNGSASTADFRAVMEEQAGSTLEWFFRQWLERPGSPEAAFSWRYDAAAGKVLLEITQQRPGDAWRLPIEVAIDGHLEAVEMTAKSQRFEFPAARPPSAVVLDPNARLLLHVASN
jgi:aminopeptidase N